MLLSSAEPASASAAWRTTRFYRTVPIAEPTMWHRLAKDAKPMDFPVEQPTNMGHVVNLRIAKAVGHAISQSILIRADEVIRWAGGGRRSGFRVAW